MTLDTKARAAAVPLVSITVLIAAKVVVGMVTGSISVLADAFDSVGDLLAALMSFFSLRMAARPPDRDHPFGHGKAENISATVEAVIIFGAGSYVIYRAIMKLIFGTQLELVELGMGIMAVSALANLFVARYLYRMARATDSPALEANARHRTTDIYTSVSIFVGLGIVRLTGLVVLDAIIALVVGAFVLKTAYDVYRKAFGGLLDESLPQKEEEIIVGCISEHVGPHFSFHELRTRKAGSDRYVELHLVMDGQVSLEGVHSMCDHLEEDIQSRLPNCTVTIHCEPAQPPGAREGPEDPHPPPSPGARPTPPEAGGDRPL